MGHRDALDSEVRASRVAEARSESHDRRPRNLGYRRHAKRGEEMKARFVSYLIVFALGMMFDRFGFMAWTLVRKYEIVRREARAVQVEPTPTPRDLPKAPSNWITPD